MNLNADALVAKNITAEIDDRLKPPQICVFDANMSCAGGAWLTEEQAKLLHAWLGRVLGPE